MVSEIERGSYDAASIEGDPPATGPGVLAIRPCAWNLREVRLTLALSFLGSRPPAKTGPPSMERRENQRENEESFDYNEYEGRIRTERRTKMATYIVLANFTDQGIRNVKDTTKRAEAIKERVFAEECG